ncbi:MAG: DUF2071 domain-containing protein [Armatimonadetes bacterium]|nr:DUF2071 domain-containing protein [Armatimonadota bacterium]
MRPKWRHLLFLHWPLSPETVQKMLPDGLEIDTFEGRAYIGLVPFTMSEVRPHFVPDLGKVGHFYENFPELNVRTYVRRGGVRGVWFFSLDAASSLAVVAARLWFGLPYFKARMRLQARGDKRRFWLRRLWPRPQTAICSARYRVGGAGAAAQNGSLEQFLVERYVLYSRKNGQLFRGRVHHAPYEIQRVELHSLRETCVAAAGFERPNQAPHAIYSRGVDVEVWKLETC